jgi:hypothetical protein
MNTTVIRMNKLINKLHLIHVNKTNVSYEQNINVYIDTHTCEHKYLFVCLFTYLFIYTSTEQSHSCEVNSCLSSHKILIIVSNLMVHNSVHQILSPVHTTCQINPVHALQSYILLINFNITHPSALWSSVSSPSFRFSHQNLVRIFLPSHARYRLHPSNPDFKYWALLFTYW